MTTALELSAITYCHPGAGRPTLAGIDLDVQDGEMVAVVGPSGSGKTTLLRVAAGLEQPETGDVLIDGISVLDVPPEGRDLTVMFQKPHLFPHLNVLDNIAFADRLRGLSRRQSRAAAQRYLELVHLGDLGRRRPRELSGGQEQRVALARGLAATRRVMLLDEPFSALDTSLRGAMQQLLMEVRAALSPTIVIVTHDLDEAGLADRVAVLVDGRVEQLDAVAQLYAAPKTVAVARLVGGFNEVTGHVSAGVHRSDLGSFTLPATCRVAGAAILLVRKERLELVAVDAGSALAGRVVQVRQSGPRQEVTVELDPSATGQRVRLDVEVRLGTVLRLGDRTGVLVPSSDALWSVPCPDGEVGERLVELREHDAGRHQGTGPTTRLEQGERLR
ncbi:ABC transporter ATP-binding protein [Sanguibacter antarcticus]|uniref:Putative spermidine/putrescine transport system ATP-binding protein n=1 Tax=Sanguibacter antarcticus TaxID=372484 RepID=A0A2A9E1F4_9MICO|nr:ABC transporter ATP-binding protein [Sanguibacter antarcticus]PFG32877.1 putative spermidine/putrescine transport system ATP-binding protein [Sanguibacter antarcticus]